ncbi:RagB/SusD family nutrient uptake outer membrane protein [Mucilaginibacter rubeus]|uniref:RagB/SusD family nutrient uptake outer membrane protein n=1 Tax=Mucilaginibacter rubeus TaxID=2027860 RepID=A0AAE6JJZ1_9SPHI|nr:MULTISPECIES: RagB/SusD family nutrient uptake outer membrane protein [Mucilaginibacter]QEM07154.1 RagB/SusD family nutrient uptake outer membrane protein [Mucilaginibacter rubeus]QEM19609.1 RagB/SusD family nutrient uptake outer membrane protein [Mucilaginibacter gossypii]QTE43701.1 RagB/SusD family nutrient uptake outer membrane protein [Mucilaginibacter rubeus]QTE50301.1 RagB/SusD family nutrient uptake outer membrane protein [Mucilaginibacter rubeus]QTE55388.1 RagB/SusD family nutrient 
MKKIYLPLTIIAVILFNGCRKYVDIRTKGQLVPNETENFRDIMNTTSTFNIGNGYPDFGDDNVDFADAAQQASLATYSPFNNVYTWAAQYFDPASHDYTWDAMYNIIFNCNVVIDGVPNSTQGSTADKNQILGEALVNRADAYMSLVRAYAKGYNAATAGTDPGVPLLITPSTDQALPRVPLQQIYAQIISDLKKAAPLMANTSKYNTLASKQAAFALLARAYLDMSDYKNAAVFADSTLAINSNILDLNTVSGNSPRNIDNPELIFSKNANVNTAYAPTVLRLSDELLNLLGTSDLRYVNFTTDASNASFDYTGRIFSVDLFLQYPNTHNCGVTVPEVMLIKAECLARSNDVSGALALINAIRRKRFAPADYQPLSASDGATALNRVLDERRRELFARGIRWSDLKRLNQESRFAKSITHVFNKQTVVLQPNSNRYVFPIAAYYFKFNKNLVQNPR